MTEYETKLLTARVILRAPDTNPHTGEQAKLLAYTKRPWWSKQGKAESAFIGGSMKDAQYKTPPLDGKVALTPDTIEAAAFQVIKEVFEETGFIIDPKLLQYVGVFTNEQGYTSITFAVDLPKKPTLLVKPESDGISWELETLFLQGLVPMLSGHAQLAVAGIGVLNQLAV